MIDILKRTNLNQTRDYLLPKLILEKLMYLTRY